MVSWGCVGLPLLVFALAACATTGRGSEWKQHTDCNACTEAGFGWSKKKRKCSPGFRNTVCAAGGGGGNVAPEPLYLRNGLIKGGGSITVTGGPTSCEAAATVQNGNQVAMRYTGTIDKSSKTGKKGKQFDSNRGGGGTFDFKIGSGKVIDGWDEGLLGLCVGSRATLVIPPHLGYGARGAGKDIPGGATLNFDVEVVRIWDLNFDQGGPPPPPPRKKRKLTRELCVEKIKAIFQANGAADTQLTYKLQQYKNEEDVLLKVRGRAQLPPIPLLAAAGGSL
jgi:hypothetical protein